MTARDELARDLAEADGIDVSWWEERPERGPVKYFATRQAEKLLAAGYRKSRTITTEAELNALPVGSVILDPAGLSLHKNEFTGWRASNGAKNIAADMLRHETLPATVLYEPEPQP